MDIEKKLKHIEKISLSGVLFGGFIATTGLFCGVGYLGQQGIYYLERKISDTVVERMEDNLKSPFITYDEEKSLLNSLDEAYQKREEIKNSQKSNLGSLTITLTLGGFGFSYASLEICRKFRKKLLKNPS
ncbi:hypothetical protein COU59_03065 [Candidatus Pacearchaeota archaeon CG10_big_fil_rev_8_21_14_0_10_34_12]|nr:MAG: hypothetical protein COU59_03065 [Candidatus Pacearchaeota archaeon CG10_big_fil_rev_8_21_14_0_10_34_12]